MNKAAKQTMIFLVAVFMMLCSAGAALTSQQVNAYYKKMDAHNKDLLQIGKAIRNADDVLLVGNLSDLVNFNMVQLENIEDLQLIESLIENEADRKRVKPVISRRIKLVAVGIDGSIRQLNLYVAHLKSQAVLATAMKVREDLHELKELLLSAD